LTKEQLLGEDFRNKNLLGFYMALMNSQLKIVNTLI